MAISNQIEKIITILDKLNGEESNGYNLNIEDGVYYISKKLQKLVDSGFGNLPVSILGSDDYDHETSEPSIDSPEENVFYLVPTGEDSNDMFEEWIYTNGKWEHFGSGGSVQDIVVDENLSIPGAAADAKATGDAFADLKSHLNAMFTATAEDEGKVLSAKTVSRGKVTEWEFINNGGEKLVYESIIENLTISNTLGYYSTSTKEFVPSTNGNFVTEPIECAEGDIFVIPDNKQMYAFAALITFDVNDDVLTCTNTNTSGTELLYTCTSADKKISFGFARSNPIDVCKFDGARGTKEIAEANEIAIERIEPDIFPEGEGINYSTLVKYPGYCRPNGLVSDYSDARCVVLRCNVGDKYKYTGKVYGEMRYYYIRKANGTIIESDTFTGDATGRTVSITNPEAYSITFSFYVGNSNTFSLYKVNYDYTKYRSDERAYDDKTWFAFGDSITYGVNGGYTTFVADKIGATLDNYGHSGDSIANALYVATNGAFGTSNGQTKLCSDYSGASVATIMIGTNGGVPDNWKTSFDNCPAFVYGQRIDTLPWSRGGSTITTADEYYALFPNDAVGKYCFMVEWMMSQNQNMKIFLITPPPRNSDTTKAEVIRDAVLAIGGKYGIPVIDCLHNCMITLQNYDLYSSDGVHLNKKGNEIWGKYIGEAIERFGAIFK